MTERTNSRYNWIKPPRAAVYLGLIYLTGLLFFGLFRGLFALTFSERLSGASIGEILTAFGIGIRFDTVILVYILIIPLLLLPWITLKHKLTRTIALIYILTLTTVSFLFLIGDIHFYRVSEAHLSYLALDYLQDGQTAWNLVLTEPGFYVGVIGWLIVSALFGWIVVRLLRTTARMKERRSWLSTSVWWVVLVAVALVGARGRVGLSPLRWGVAYISNNHTVNQLGMNGIWSLMQTLQSEKGDPRLSYLPEDRRFPFVPFAESLALTQRIIVQPNDSLIAPDSSIERLTHQPQNRLGFQPNVVIVLMESFSARLIGALESDLGLTPEFDRLANHGILFDKFYAGGERTSYGMSATLGSSPALPGRSVQKRYGAAHPFRAISEILSERGYYNLLAYGGDKVFDNIDGFYRSKQYDAIWGDEDFGESLVFAKWGIPDHTLFEQLVQMSDTLPRPFNLTILTLSNHEPFDLPDSSLQLYLDDAIESKVRNVFHYADWSLGQFIEQFETRPSFDSTIFLFVADHARYEWKGLNVNPDNFHIPLLIYSPSLLGDSGQIISTVGGQVDIIPTLLGLLGDQYRHSSWGRDLLEVDSTETGFALLRVADRLGWIEDGYLYLEPLGREPLLFEMSRIATHPVDCADDHPEMLNRLQTRMRAYVQTAEQLSTPGSIE